MKLRPALDFESKRFYRILTCSKSGSYYAVGKYHVLNKCRVEVEETLDWGWEIGGVSLNVLGTDWSN